MHCLSIQDTPVHRCHPEALRYTQGKNFAKTKMELARRLHELYNREIFGTALPDDMPIGLIILRLSIVMLFDRLEREADKDSRALLF